MTSLTCLISERSSVVIELNELAMAPVISFETCAWTVKSPAATSETSSNNFLIDLSSTNRVAMIMRVTMLLIAAAIVVYQWRVVWPKVEIFRKQYIDHADEPEVANPAKDQFDNEQKQSVTLMMIVLFLLLGIILFSGNIMPAKVSTTPSNASGLEK